MSTSPYPPIGVVLVTLLCASLAWAARLPTQYHVVSLGAHVIVLAIDDDGTVLFVQDGWTFLRTPAGQILPVPVGGNTLRQGVVVGGVGSHAALWRPGQTVVDLGTLGSPALFSF